jgi:hypothetical protein
MNEARSGMVTKKRERWRADQGKAKPGSPCKERAKKGQTGLSKASAQRRTFSTKIFFEKNRVFFEKRKRTGFRTRYFIDHESVRKDSKKTHFSNIILLWHDKQQKRLVQN